MARKTIGKGGRERNRVNCETANCKFFTTPLSHNSQKRLEHKENQTEYRKTTRKSRSHVRILIYRTFAIES